MSRNYKTALELKRSIELAATTIEKAAGYAIQGGGCYLVLQYGKRSDLPRAVSTIRMVGKAVENLAALGLHDPIPLRLLPGKWWKAHVDAYSVGEFGEPGAMFVERYLTSEKLSGYAFEVVDGPFEPWANIEVAKAILELARGKYWDASISNRPLLPVVEGQQFFGADNAYSSDELHAALTEGQHITIYSGPYEAKEDAHYAIDIRWESPGD